MPVPPLIVTLLAASLAGASAPEGPVFELHPGSQRTDEQVLSPELLSAFEALLPAGQPEDGPLLVTATRRTPRLSLAATVPPRSVGERRGPPEEALFLLSVSSLAPAEGLDPGTAGRLADLFYTEGRLALHAAVAAHVLAEEQCRIWDACPAAPFDTAEAERWMSAALPLYRQAAHGTVRRSERLALRMAWAALLGGGTREDLELVSCLIEGGFDDTWSAEARLVFGTALARPETWDNLGALDALTRASVSPDLPYPAETQYRLAWAWYNLGELSRSIETLKGAIFTSISSSQASPVASAAILDIFDHFGEIGEDPFGGHGAPLREAREALYRRLASSYLAQGRFENALQISRYLAADGLDTAPLLPLLIEGLESRDPWTRLDILDELARRHARSQSPPHAALSPAERTALSDATARAAAELHYLHRDTLTEAQVARIRYGYDRSLALDPEHRDRAAIEALRDSLQGATPAPSDRRR